MDCGKASDEDEIHLVINKHPEQFKRVERASGIRPARQPHGFTMLRRRTAVSGGFC